MQINVNQVSYFELKQLLLKWFLPVMVSVLGHCFFLLNFESNKVVQQSFSISQHKTAFSIAMKNVDVPQKQNVKKVSQTKGNQKNQTIQQKQEMFHSVPVLSKKEVNKISIKPHYPLRAIENNWQGKSVLLVKIINGKTSDVIIEETSGYQILDSSAIRAIKKLKTPMHITLSEYWIRIPVEFIIS